MPLAPRLRSAAFATLALISIPLAAASAFVLTTTDSGLGIADVEVGTGKEVQAGKTVEVHYTGWLYIKNTKGRQVDTSREGKPFTFTVGKGEVMPAWDEGIVGMKVGGRRTLLIPAELGYGEKGFGKDVPPNSPVIFDLEVIDVKD
ncbi:FKBP-type peptidyl-prolyl cis-trans isomerase [Hyphomicrobium sp. D-2]|uniref:FKBP-type peptidyl-prolyl cis-trans isomerase n=1 Tax=Hyphomicrobium sp. D-2 TaxID=3041621 RepID=UPI002458BE49|nr:FKBP-type peptidyl-prolyl cis-trans isomerase [Hyphomicrobium sp. D-2]MDH4982078.1 FKBP-type peptidyl-prolyl cis-trans isomerase [Hyphomicrobium sp. D-2]